MMKPAPKAVQVPQCFTCKYFHQEAGGYTCAAFPSRIPDAILHFEHDHAEPFPGDNGIRYERSTPAPQLPKRDRPLWT